MQIPACINVLFSPCILCFFKACANWITLTFIAKFSPTVWRLSMGGAQSKIQTFKAGVTYFHFLLPPLLPDMTPAAGSSTKLCVSGGSEGGGEGGVERATADSDYSEWSAYTCRRVGGGRPTLIAFSYCLLRQTRPPPAGSFL